MFCFHSWKYQPMFRRKLHLLWSTNTHTRLTERASTCSMHTHTHDILTIRNSAHTLICIDLPCMHAPHREHLPMTTLPHDYSCMYTETEPRSSVKWPRSTTDTKDLFQMPVNSLCLVSTFSGSSLCETDPRSEGCDVLFLGSTSNIMDNTRAAFEMAHSLE